MLRTAGCPAILAGPIAVRSTQFGGGISAIVLGHGAAFSVLDTATNTVVATVAAGSGPVAFGQFIGPALATGPLCDIQLNRTTFVTGDQVIAQVARLANPGLTPVPVEVKLWFELPGSPPPVPFLTVGADGLFVLPPGSDHNYGPLPLATVPASVPRGAYSFDCRLLHAVTGETLAEDRNPFTLQ